MPGTSEIKVSGAEPSQWDALLAQFSQATVFHTMPWLRTVAETHGLNIQLARADRDGRCVGVWPCLWMRKGPLKVMGSPLPGWSTAYLGPLVAAEVEPQVVLPAFLEHKLFRRYAYFACKVLIETRPIDMAAYGFKFVVKFDTYRIDTTQDESVIWDNMKSECRSRIRKAEKLGIEIRTETTSDFIDDYWQMSIETFAKANIQPTHNKRFLVELWKHLSAVNRVHVLSAHHEGERVAMLVLPFDAHGMYYWGGASYLKHRDLPAHNLLHWHGMRDAKKFGMTGYDFISTFGGPGRFKKTFGPDTVEIATHWERSPSKLMAALKTRYESYLRKKQRVEA